MISENTEYTATYKNMVGVDFSKSSSDSVKRRYAYVENMYRDYENGDASLIESVPGFRKVISLGGRIHAIYPHKDKNGENHAVVHSGNKVFRFKTSMRDTLTYLSPIAEIKNGKSSAFRFGSDLYILDGEQILKISADGEAIKISSEENSVYIPTTFYNGVRIEQKNLLTDRFKEKYVIGAAETVIYGSPGLMYRITNEQLGLCAVVGISSTFRGILNIPSYATIGTKRYKVDEISDNAFLGNALILGVKLGIGIYRIGKFAFSGCTMLSSFYAYNAPSVIDDCAFKDCDALNTFYIGAEIEKFGEQIFEGCTALRKIHYASDEKSFGNIENSSALPSLDIYSFQYDFSLTLEIPINTPLKEIISITVGGEPLSSYDLIMKSETKTSVVFAVSDFRTVEGKEVVIYARYSPDLKDSEGALNDFISDYGYNSSGFDAICGCTVCESFDGRVFLSGNPSLPGVVFYSSRETGSNSLYFGSYNYFCDGFGVFGVSSMLSCGDSLLVFKNADDGGGSIFYHTPNQTDISFMPKVYPVTYTHNGIGAVGNSFSFFDDPIFISKSGVSAIDKRTISLERSIACRSHNVNAELLSEDLRYAALAEWCGYLAVGINGKIYLADSRAIFTHISGYREYEWYAMKDVGTWENDTIVYRYSSTSHSGFLVHEAPESEVKFTVYSTTVNEERICYVYIEGQKYEVYPTEETTGGTFHPLVTLASFDGDLLFFGTDNGDVCVFNNDKRGVAPQSVANAADFNEEEYKKFYGRSIHPFYYTFGTHRMRCGVLTAPHDCGRPDLAKNTVKHSLILKCRLQGSGKIKCEAKTNRSGYTEYSAFPNSIPDFSDFSFASLTLDSEPTVSLPINEKEKNWIDKELSVYCDDFRSPIGVYSLSYRYTFRARIKHT